MSADDISPEEERILRFRHENEVNFRAAQFGVDVDDLINRHPAGMAMVEASIDALQNALIQLVDADLSSEHARKLQIEALAHKYLIEFVRTALENGDAAVDALTEEQQLEEERYDG